MTIIKDNSCSYCYKMLLKECLTTFKIPDGINLIYGWILCLIFATDHLGSELWDAVMASDIPGHLISAFSFLHTNASFLFLLICNTMQLFLAATNLIWLKHLGVIEPHEHLWTELISHSLWNDVPAAARGIPDQSLSLVQCPLYTWWLLNSNFSTWKVLTF